MSECIKRCNGSGTPRDLGKLIEVMKIYLNVKELAPHVFGRQTVIEAGFKFCWRLILCRFI